MRETQETAGVVTLNGERLCLDFINTLSNRATAAPVERLNTSADLLAWSRQAGIVSEQEVDRLRTPGKKQTAQMLQEVREAREVLFRIFSAFPGEQFNALLALTMQHTQPGWREGGFA